MLQPRRKQRGPFRQIELSRIIPPRTARRTIVFAKLNALLRREGLYSSHLNKWREQRDRAIRQALAPQKRGRKVDPQAAEMERLRQENERLKARLEQAEMIIDVQKKLVTLFGTEPNPTPSDEGR